MADPFGKVVDHGHSLGRNCPVCGQGEGQPWLRKAEMRLVRCPACAMVYVNPVPEEMASGEYYDREGSGYYVSEAKRESDYADVRFARELKLFRRHCRTGAVLDVGCSSGAFLYQLRRQFPGDYEVLGTDVSGPSLDYAESRGIGVVRGDFLRQDFGGRLFDAVTFWAVLEHLVEPAAFLDKTATLLKQSGRCFVLVPNLSSLATRLLGARYRYIYSQHLNYFTRETLSRLVGARFSPVAFRSTHFNPVVIWQDWRNRGREVTNVERAELLKRTTAYKQSRAMRPLRYAYRLSERVLGSLNLADNLVVVLEKRQDR